MGYGFPGQGGVSRSAAPERDIAGMQQASGRAARATKYASAAMSYLPYSRFLKRPSRGRLKRLEIPSALQPNPPIIGTSKECCPHWVQSRTDCYRGLVLQLQRAVDGT